MPFWTYWKFVHADEGALSYQMWLSQTLRSSVLKSSRKTWWYPRPAIGAGSVVVGQAAVEAEMLVLVEVFPAAS